MKIVFIDTEVSVADKKIDDYGAITEYGARLHSRSGADFYKFISSCDTLCGHNIINHDLKYLKIDHPYNIIDTLPLSALLFPRNPYHKLVKDDKLQVDELNNPLNDAIRCKDLFYDELAAWNDLTPIRQEIYIRLLKDQKPFHGFIQLILPNTQKNKHSFLFWKSSNEFSKYSTAQLILQDFAGKICPNADISSFIKSCPIELAYCLAVIGVDDLHSLTPAWILRNYPKINNVMNALCNTLCNHCDYCNSRLDAHKGLKDFFGYSEFRIFDDEKMQQQAVEAAIRGESLLTIFPTGGGKSLTFQLPALIAGRNIHGLTVVISPLQSLMKDQVDNLNARGISEVVSINGLLDPIERQSAINQVENGSANILYIAPEMLRNRTIQRLLMQRTVVRFVIDEAHCFSAWGQDFRTDYLYIGDFIRKLQEQKQLPQPIPVSCFTATAKQKVISDIQDYFKNKLGCNLRLFAAKAERKNLRYTVLHAETAENKYNILRELIISHPCPTIVYVSRTRITRMIAERLCRDGITALPFNGKMDVADKVHNQNAFMSGQIQVIVATSALGMGVDKKDVGLVVHYDISDSLESYVQEAGRAGRDPQMHAECYVLFSDTDLDKHFILLNQTKLSLSEIQQVWKAIKDFSSKRPIFSCSAHEIARQAGWDTGNKEIETRVKSAITALEQAGYIVRGDNMPHVFASGIRVRSMDEAREKITISKLFDEKSREQAARIIRSLISSRATTTDKETGESRVDYLADILGLTKETVIRNINLMRQEGLLADTRDMQAFIDYANINANLEHILKLERYILDHLSTDVSYFNYKQFNAEAQEAGHKRCNVKQLYTLLYFLLIKGYIRKEENTAEGSVKLRLQVDIDNTFIRFEKRKKICQFVVQQFMSLPDYKGKSISFSLIDLLNKYNSQPQELFNNEKSSNADIYDMEEALLYLSKTGMIKIEGGFMVIYNSMRLERKVERSKRYNKEQYRLLDEFYKQRIQQIHIVGEFANIMVKDYDAALRFVSDYFLKEYNDFINTYFKGEKRTEINKNITPKKYHQIFNTLSVKQQYIINDKQSKYIVVAAGPGSGKTRVLVHKLASLLILEDVKHEQLLMLTFSRAAATEFKKRLLELVGNAAHRVDIKTFHSYAFDLLGRQGSLDESESVVARAAQMIRKGEVEENKIIKSVLVIDEAQDMSSDDFLLVQSLMMSNEEMRVIAVGDDDQNIYQFRGSSSRYLQTLIRQYNATLYELTDNFRSEQTIVDYANNFVQQLTHRIKTDPIISVSKNSGTLDANANITNLITNIHQDGTTAVLTRTNEQTLQIAYLLKQQGKHVCFIQQTDGFRFANLAEIRFFLKHIGGTEGAISPERWQAAKQRTEQKYATSKCLEPIKRFFREFETTYTTLYLSDLTEFIFESSIDDFISTEDNTIFVSTIHKAKGREFDTVHLLTFGTKENNNDQISQESLRTLYVGITRAKKNLYIYNQSPTINNSPTIDDQPLLPSVPSIVFGLGMKDVWLESFGSYKDLILQLRSGDQLFYTDGKLRTSNGQIIGSLSASMRNRIGEQVRKGYYVSEAEVSYIIAWHPQDQPQDEIAICLANLILTK